MRVASPNSSGREPVTFGSSVPACATRSMGESPWRSSASATNLRTQSATWWAEGPGGLSRLQTPNPSNCAGERSRGGPRISEVVRDVGDVEPTLVGARVVSPDGAGDDVEYTLGRPARGVDDQVVDAEVLDVDAVVLAVSE